MVKLLQTFTKQFGSFVCVSPYYGVPPYYAGEILRQIAGKVVIEATRNDVIVSVKILQVYVRHDADGEALVHSMRSMQLLFQTIALAFYWRSRNIVISGHDARRPIWDGGIYYSNHFFYTVDSRNN